MFVCWSQGNLERKVRALSVSDQTKAEICKTKVIPSDSVNDLRMRQS